MSRDEAVTIAPPRLAICPDCGTEAAPRQLYCPACHALIYRDRLLELAAQADAAETAGYLRQAIALWRSALALLPRESGQYQSILERVDQLSRRIERGEGTEPPPEAASPGEKRGWGKRAAAGAGTAGAFLLKFKTLLLGLAKMSTLLSMLASFGVYWSFWGWKFALGFVLCIYVHEMGHIERIRRYGIPASAPMFIPGFGALISLRSSHLTPREDNRIGLAGPLWGMAATFFCFALYAFTRNPLYGALSYTSALINIFNLLPFWTLDGARGLHSMSRNQRWMLVAAFAFAWFVSREGLFLIIAAFTVWKCFEKDLPSVEDWPGFSEFLAIVAGLTFLLMMSPRA